MPFHTLLQCDIQKTILGIMQFSRFYVAVHIIIFSVLKFLKNNFNLILSHLSLKSKIILYMCIYG